ncbi:hypothetical protein FM037_05930 [Shewanella psychropiezotolerans]|uniref:Secreted protein n=1 Tax=Shewanella psychropiezotolerans TaxID=2593655 RepID=A0ABX5WXD1_9GAMM|nr:hypothetical protein [Shewanella psychropiezotolerans]QDO82852.1 hypothetical protein FM037_05930 [Shewanella psychropiezotolerans]
MWFLVVSGGFWWFLVVSGGFWWFLVVSGGLCISRHPKLVSGSSLNTFSVFPVIPKGNTIPSKYLIIQREFKAL